MAPDPEIKPRLSTIIICIVAKNNLCYRHFSKRHFRLAFRSGFKALWITRDH